MHQKVNEKGSGLVSENNGLTTLSSKGIKFDEFY